MRKIIFILISLSIFLGGFNFFVTKNDIQEKDKKIIQLENRLKEIDTEKISNGNKDKLKMDLLSLTFNKINYESNSTLTCIGKYSTTLGVFQTQGKSTGSVGINSEKFDLMLFENRLNMFGADFNIILNNDNYVVGMRTYEDTGLTELLHLNKNNGILIDSKTYTSLLGKAPSSFDVLFLCN